MSQTLDAKGRAAILRVLADPIFELIPLNQVLDQVPYLPDGATVSVTASPTRTLEDTLDIAAELQQRGFTAIPHLSARMTRDHRHLERLLARVAEIGVHRLFVVGGDAEFTGAFYDAGSLLRAMEDIGHDVTDIGIAAYPEGHHLFDDGTARLALHDKQAYATSMTTQMCFDASAIEGWLTKMRDDGIELPVHVGLPGVADRMKLLRISARIGVGQSARFLSHNRGLIRNFVSPGGYSPDELLEDMAGTLADEPAGIVGVHIYTFNQVETTERWRREYLASLEE